MKKKDKQKNISGILNRLMKESPDEKKKKRAPDSSVRMCSLGTPLIRSEDQTYYLNMDNIRLFSGMSDFVHQLCSDITGKCRSAPGDILVKYSVDPGNNPELFDAGISGVCLYAPDKSVNRICKIPEEFQRRMSLAFNAIQSPRWLQILIPESSENRSPESPVALLFPFHLEEHEKENGQIFLFEYVPDGKYLRITVDDAEESRLNLKRIPHRVVARQEGRGILGNLEKTASEIFLALHRQAENQQNEYKETPSRQPDLFHILQESGLPRLSSIRFLWPPETGGSDILEKPDEIKQILCRLLLALTDSEILQIVSEGNLLKIGMGNRDVYLDLRTDGVRLNVSLDRPRKKADIGEHLMRLPKLNSLLKNETTSLENIRILFIHHVTSEILGLLKVFEHLHPAHFQTLFIKYKGIVPDNHLESLISLSPDEFHFTSLQKVESTESVEGRYYLSRQYSSVDDLLNLDDILRERKLNYIDAMILAGGHLFFREVMKAMEHGQKLYLIEDGGYLAPMINRSCLENKTLGETLEQFGISFDELNEGADPDMPLEEWLRDVFCGSVEHTRNGHDRVQKVNDEFGKLAFPACSIAISEYKNIEEARECAFSILNAIETIFHGMGMLLSKRDVMVIGSMGFIGSGLVRALKNRLHEGNLCGIDIAMEKIGMGKFHNQAGFIEKSTIYRIPEERLLDIDLIIGMTGHSVLKKDVFEKLLLEGTKRTIYFASGSTKTVEFEDLSLWLEELDKPGAKVGDVPVKIDITPLNDPQSGLVLGKRARIHMENSGWEYKDFILMADLMPVNFLYYGVPAEVIDQVLVILLKMFLGLVKATNEGKKIPRRFMALDRDIGFELNPLKEE